MHAKEVSKNLKKERIIFYKIVISFFEMDKTADLINEVVSYFVIAIGCSGTVVSLCVLENTN